MELRAKRILVVEEGRAAFEMATEILNPVAAHLTHVSSVDSALHRIRAWKPHVILLDWSCLKDLSEASGVVSSIRGVSAEDYAGIVLLCEASELEEVDRLMIAGADDFLLKPLRRLEFHSRLSCAVRARELHDQIRRSQQRIEELTTSDELTGLNNMKYLFRQGEEDIARCRRFRKAVSALLVDIDHFSTVNEAHGFSFGSFVIREVGALVRSCVRKVDRVARVGADEYFILLPETDLAGAQFVAERIRDTVQGHEHRSEKEVARVTVSIGVAGFGIGEDPGSISDFFRNANEALRSAKIAGANRIEVFSFA
jgi:diguanylate cyclase (GGDEF)-like protein